MSTSRQSRAQKLQREFRPKGGWKVPLSQRLWFASRPYRSRKFPNHNRPDVKDGSFRGRILFNKVHKPHEPYANKAVTGPRPHLL